MPPLFKSRACPPAVYHLCQKKRSAPPLFPIATLTTKAAVYRTILILRIKTGNTFRFSASAIAQHPTKIPDKYFERVGLKKPQR